MSAPTTGVLVTASKVVVPFKTELLESLKSERFAKRPPHLVGILATKKDDARSYAEVSFQSRIGTDISSPRRPVSSLASTLSFA